MTKIEECIETLKKIKECRDWGYYDEEKDESLSFAIGVLEKFKKVDRLKNLIELSIGLIKDDASISALFQLEDAKSITNYLIG